MQFLNYFLGDPREKEYQKLYERATQLYEDKKYEKAVEVYEKCLQYCNDSDIIEKGNIYNRIAIIFEKLGEYTNSVQYFKKSVLIAKEAKDEKAEFTATQNMKYVIEKSKKQEFLSSVLHSVVSEEKDIPVTKIKYFTSVVLPLKIRLAMISYLDITAVVTPDISTEHLIKHFYGYIVTSNNNCRKAILVFPYIELKGDYSGKELSFYVPQGVTKAMLNGRFRDSEWYEIPKSIHTLIFMNNPGWSEKSYVNIFGRLDFMKRLCVHFTNDHSRIFGSRVLKSKAKDVEVLEGMNIPHPTLVNVFKKLQKCKTLILSFEVYDENKFFTNLKCKKEIQEMRLKGFIVGSKPIDFRFLNLFTNLRIFECYNTVNLEQFLTLLEKESLRKLSLNLSDKESNRNIEEKTIQRKIDDLENKNLTFFEALKESDMSIDYYRALGKCENLQVLWIPYESIDSSKMSEILKFGRLSDLKIESHQDLIKINDMKNLDSIHIICKESVRSFKKTIKNIKYLTLERNSSLHYTNNDISFNSRMFSKTNIRSLTFINFKFTHEQEFLSFIKEKTKIFEFYYRRYKWTRNLK